MEIGFFCYEFKCFSFILKGLKTGVYYLRTRPAVDPIKFTVDKGKIKAGSSDDDGICISCSS